MKTVLIVDDEKLFLASLAEGLSTYADEFEVVTAENGKRAAEVLAKQPIDMVVTDLKMPVMDGFQLVAHMMCSHPQVPVIVMTAFGTPEIEERLQEYAPLGYLEKPIDFQVLADKVRAGLAQTPKGHIRGITLFSFLQLLEMEKKTCLLQVKSDSNEGSLYFEQGEMVDAVYGDIVGEPAAYEIASWDDVEIEIVKISRKGERRIETSLSNLLMEAARLKDERSRGSEEEPEEIDLGAIGEAAAPSPSDRDAQPSESDHSAQIQPSVDSPASNISDIATPASGKGFTMASNVKESIEQLMQIDGAVVAALVDSQSGMALGAAGNSLNLEVAAAVSSEVMRAKLRAIQSLGLNDKVEDILISLSSQYHLIRPLSTTDNLFLYLVLSRAQSNLAMARLKLADVESRVQI